jgi:hypothetical protein
MRFAWVLWPVGAVILGIAGFVTSLLPKRRAQAATDRVAWSSAQAAIAAAGVSRDAALHSVPEAKHLLLRAELLAARHGGAGMAAEAEACARQADELWRATIGA